MANRKITELPDATVPLAGTELAEVVQGGVNKKVAVSNVSGTTLSKAAVSDINTGTDDAKYITSLGLQGSKYETVYRLRSFATSTSSPNTYVATLTPAITTYGSGGLLATIKFTNANTGAATINLNGLGAKSILKNDGSPLTSGDIAANYTALLQYDGTNFRLVNPAVVADAGDIDFVILSAYRNIYNY